MSDPTKPSAPAAFGPRQTFAVSREQFNSIPQRRARYILAYIAYVAGVFGPRVAAMTGAAVPTAIIYPGYALGLAVFAVFAYNFFITLRTMGYERWFATALVLVCAPLFPGFLLLAYMDRRIATAWDAADPSGGYRQRPPSGKDTQ